MVSTIHGVSEFDLTHSVSYGLFLTV